LVGNSRIDPPWLVITAWTMDSPMPVPPVSAAALAAAKATKCSVVVAKLDRLSRDVAFVAGLMAQRVPFMVAEGEAVFGR
jgi:hypothetical protein